VPPAIRVVAICRDEEDAVGGFLDQFAPLTRDWCLLDTGSTDRTVAVARERGARVESTSFVDFASARNEALDRFGAGADWIVMLDLDERLDVESISHIAGLAASDAFDVWLAPLDAVHADGTRRVQTPKLFLFRNDPSLRWTFAVHEKLVGSMRQALVRNARMDHIIALHDPARRDRAAAFYAALMEREPYFTDAAFRERMRERWPIVDHERLADPRLASVVAGPLVSVVVPTFARRALVGERGPLGARAGLAEPRGDRRLRPRSGGRGDRGSAGRRSARAGRRSRPQPWGGRRGAARRRHRARARRASSPISTTTTRGRPIMSRPSSPPCAARTRRSRSRRCARTAASSSSRRPGAPGHRHQHDRASPRA
jgi:hypothetical protein